MKKLMFVVLVCVFGVLMAASAMATVLDFEEEVPTTGSISYAGGLAPLVGTGIDVDFMTGLGTPSNSDGSLLFQNAFLNFTTGAMTGVWEWGGGPDTTITIVGGVPGLGIPDGTPLLTGNFGSAQVIQSTNEFHIAGASFFDIKDPRILDFYGLPGFLPSGEPFPYAGNFNISFQALSTQDGMPFTSTLVLNGDLVNTPIPEPASMLLFGSGLLAYAGVRRFRRKLGKK